MSLTDVVVDMTPYLKLVDDAKRMVLRLRKAPADKQRVPDTPGSTPYSSSNSASSDLCATQHGVGFCRGCHEHEKAVPLGRRDDDRRLWCCRHALTPAQQIAMDEEHAVLPMTWQHIQVPAVICHRTTGPQGHRVSTGALTTCNA